MTFFFLTFEREGGIQYLWLQYNNKEHDKLYNSLNYIIILKKKTNNTYL